VDRLWGMTGKGTVREASEVRSVTPAELKRLKGSRPKRGREAGSGSFNGCPTHVSSSPVYRGALPPVYWCNLRNVVSLYDSRGESSE
jgi:hypothetical protein